VTRPAKRVLIVGWDGADWRILGPLLEKGLMPNLQAMVESGVMGNLSSLQPMLSPMLWTSIATGKHADAHGILGFAEPDPESGSPRPVRSTSRRCKALWNLLSEAGLKAGVVRWLATHPAERINGFVVSDQFSVAPRQAGGAVRNPAAVWPGDLAEDLAQVAVRPADLTLREMADFVRVDDPGVRSDPRADKLPRLVADMATTQALATLLMQTEDWDFLGVYFEAFDRFSHHFMEFHPPKLPQVSEEDFERYQHVMTSCCRFHDMMLGRLLELAGPHCLTLLISDHGFHSDHLRPDASPDMAEGEPVAWHRPHGILVAAGPETRKDELVFGAGLLDIAPTVLAALGLPVPEDMPGQVLKQIWPAGALTWETTDTYETGEPQPVADDSQDEEDPWVAAQAIKRLVDLGYIEDTSLEGLEDDRRRSLAVVYACTGRSAEALAEMEKLAARGPLDLSATFLMAQLALRTGDYERSRELADQVLAARAEGPWAHLLKGRALLLEGDTSSALEQFAIAAQAQPNLPDLHLQLGMVYLSQERWTEAEQAFQTALAADPCDARGHSGLGTALREQGRLEEAIDAYTRAVGLLHHQPAAHLQLGITLLQAGKLDWAIRALEVTVSLDPEEARAHRLLAEVYRTYRIDPVRAAGHARRAQCIEDGRKAQESGA